MFKSPWPHILHILNIFQIHQNTYFLSLVPIQSHKPQKLLVRILILTRSNYHKYVPLNNLRYTYERFLKVKQTFVSLQVVHQAVRKSQDFENNSFYLYLKNSDFTCLIEEKRSENA